MPCKCDCLLCSKTEACLDDFNKDGYSLLAGNGIFCNRTLTFNYQDIKDKLLEKLQQLNKDKDFKLDCPEKLLNIFRVEVSLEILKWYKEKFSGFSTKLENPQKYIGQFPHLFTINYDPITYRLIFDPKGSKTNFSDGFDPQGGISLSNIKERLEKEPTNIMYIHGAFHIIYHYQKDDSKHLYEKITAKKNSTLMHAILEKHEEIERKHSTLDMSQAYQDIFCVLDSRPIYKKAWIQHDPYLNYCFERLGTEKNILTLGCSFANDDHLLEKILLNQSLENLCIGVYRPQDRINICNAYKRISNYPHNQGIKEIIEGNRGKISFVSTGGLQKMLWDD